MKTGLTIKEMAQELLRQSKAKQDYLVNTGSLSLSVTSDAPQLRVTEEGTDKIAPLDIRQTAHRQLGTYLGIPQKYYELMRTDAPELLAYNANYWFSQKNELRTLRTIDGCARAFLSNRYPRRVPHVHEHPRAGCQNGVLCRFWVLAGCASEGRRKPAEQRCAHARRCSAGVAAPLGCVIQ